MHFQQYFEIEADTKGLVIFDRDGTLIEDYKGLSRSDMVKWLPGRISSLANLTASGYTIGISTNQGAIEEGLISVDELLAVHKAIVSDAHKAGIKIWAIIFCPHSKLKSGKMCECRKPRPGMILELHRRFIATNPRLVFFGDKDSDLEAAQTSGLTIDSILVDKENFSDLVDEWIGIR